MKRENLDLKFEELYRKINRPSFLNMDALGGEIPFFITTYNPEQEVDVYKNIHSLKNRLENKGIPVVEVNLYDICIGILEERNLLKKILDKEPDLKKDKLFKQFQMLLDVKSNIVPKICNSIQEKSFRIVLLTGIGQIYPYIRTHSILENLQSVIKDKPLICFYPGVYDGTHLRLFGKTESKNYYRAFNLDQMKI